MLPITLHIMTETYASAKFDVAMSNSLGDMLLYEKLLFNLDLGLKVTQNVAQYPLHHVTYEVATSNSSGDAFTRKYIV